MRSARGWSLVELVMVIIIVGTLAAFIGPLLLKAVSAYDMTEGTVGAYAKMRYAMERIAREVHFVALIREHVANHLQDLLLVAGLVHQHGEHQHGVQPW